MSEMNPMDPTPAPTAPTNQSENAAAEALAKLTAAGGPGFDRSQMDELKAKLAKLPKANPQTTGEPDTSGAGAIAPDNRPLTGRDVDWSEYNLDYNVAHLYKKAVYQETPQGPKWVAVIADFISTSKDFRSHGQRCNPPGEKDLPYAEQEPKNLGEYLNNMVNGRDQWTIAAVMPSSNQCGVLLERQVPIILPDPQPLKKSEEVEPPSDQALQTVEDAALAFMAEQGGVDNQTDPSDYSSAAPAGDIGLRPVDPETAQAIKETLEAGAVEARMGAGVARAIQTAAGETIAAPTAGVIQPEAVAGNAAAVSNANPEGKVAAAGVSAAQDILRALSDPNFRASLPQE